LKKGAAHESLRTTDLKQQWRAEVWWCPGRLLDCIGPTEF